MSPANILSNHKLLPRTAHSVTPTDYLTEFEQVLNSLVQVWHNYQPDDSLADKRKQDLEWLKSKLRYYRLNIHNSSNSQKFWQGFMAGKNSRRILSDRTSKSLGKILFGALKSQQIYDLGSEVGWCYARLKDYLQRIKKQRKLEEAQRYQDYQKISSLIHRTDDTDSLLSVGWMRERKSSQ